MWLRISAYRTRSSDWRIEFLDTTGLAMQLLSGLRRRASRTTRLRRNLRRQGQRAVPFISNTKEFGALSTFALFAPTTCGFRPVPATNAMYCFPSTI